MASCGFDSLPNQIATRRVRYGLSFNVLVVGQPGLGKTNLIQSLFQFDYSDAPDDARQIDDVSLHIKEFKPPNDSLEFKLTVIETKGFGNQEDKSQSYKPIEDHITARFEEYLTRELVGEKAAEYDSLSDTRIHCCVYMLSSRSLDAIDIVTMKHLHDKVCLIPVIAKSDHLAPDKRLAYKENVRQELNRHGIETYSKRCPFTIASSNEFTEENGKRQRVRVYPWGRVNIEKHTEFTDLRELICRSDMLKLIKHTNEVHYANYRREVTSEEWIHKAEREYELFKKNYENVRAALKRELGEPTTNSSFISSSPRAKSIENNVL